MASAIDRFLIAPIEGGLQTSLKPWLIPDSAFQVLKNAYVFRGRVIKRFGARLMEGTSASIPGYEQLVSRLGIIVGTTHAMTGNFSGTVPGAIFEVGQMFSIGSQVYTVHQSGNPGTMINTGTGTATYDTTTGAVVITAAATSSSVYFYPAQPVMGIINYEQDGLFYDPVIAFDTQFAYKFTSSGWSRLGTAVWTGDNSQFFWGYNWRGSTSDLTYLYVTNYNYSTTLNGSDFMKYWDGSSWNDFKPIFNSGAATNTIPTSRIIVPFKDRLVLLNVVENTGASPGTNKVYVNRCRYSWNGDPTNVAAFYEDVPGGGGFIDAPTKEEIITAQFLKDRLIVYFQESTWELVYTGNQILPFVWQQINTELGAESTFSQIPFDKAVLGIGNVGVHACNGSNVERIDDNIPETVFQIHNLDGGPQRVYGIRDYFSETVYWAYPQQTQGSSDPFPNQILVYNYKTGSWAINDDSVTAFGYYQSETSASGTWQETNLTWQNSSFPWVNAPIQALFRSIIAGNQEGFVFIVESGSESGSSSTNCQSLQITNIENIANVGIFTVINHNLKDGDYVLIEGCQGSTNLNGFIAKVNPYDLTTGNYTPNNFSAICFNTLPVPGYFFDAIPVGTYSGGGTLTRVTPPSIATKQYNFYVQEGRNAYVSKVDFLVTRTELDDNNYGGQFTVDFATSSSDESLVFSGTLNGSIVGTSIVETTPYALVPQESNQARLWHPVYLLADGECIQLSIYQSDEQAMNPTISSSEFEIHALIFYSQRASSRLQ